jgi:AP endonuclease 1
MVRTSPRKAQQSVVQGGKVENTVTVATTSNGANGHSKVTVAKTKVQKQDDTKRKASPDYEEDDSLAVAEPNRPAKKRKTKAKEKSAAAAMPLAERTAVTSLKKAMYLGAHVSAAGGIYSYTKPPS